VLLHRVGLRARRSGGDGVTGLLLTSRRGNFYTGAAGTARGRGRR
jgi:hypothetical protein